MARDGELRLEAMAGTLEGYGQERALRVYESSIRRADTGEPLLTIVSGGNGLRLTPAQVVELHNYTAEWLGLA